MTTSGAEPDSAQPQDRHVGTLFGSRRVDYTSRVRSIATLLVIWILTLANASTQMTPAARNIGSASLSGRVIDYDTDKPLVGALVTLYKDAQPIRDTLTDARGEYAFPKLPAGTYHLRAFIPGYLNTSYGQKKPERQGTLIVLTEKESLVDLTIRMFRASVIAGLVTGMNGQPLVGATLQLYRTSYRPGGRFLSPLEAAKTDDRGQYRVFGLSPGEYFVRVADTIGWRMHIVDPALDVQATPAEGYSPTFYPNAATPAEAMPIVLNAAEERTGIDVIVPMTPLERIRGRLVGPIGPVIDARFTRVLDENLMSEGDTLDATVTPDGRFVLANVPHGPLVLMVRSRPSRQAKASDAERLFAVVRTVVSRNMSELVVQMNPGLVISGTVRFAAANASTQPSGKVFIGLRGLESRRWARNSFSARRRRATGDSQFVACHPVHTSLR